MDERWSTHVRPILHVLVEILLPLALIDRLYAVALITFEEFETIQACDNVKGSRMLLVSILPRKGPDSFDQFLSVLKETEGQKHVAQQIMGRQKKFEQKREEDITELKRKLKVERAERVREKQELIKEKEAKENDLKKEKATNIGLRNKIGPSMGRSLKWNFSIPNMPIDCWPFGCVAEIKGRIHVGWKDKMLQLKEGTWEGENHDLGFRIGSVFECEGKGYVMHGGGLVGQCKNIYEWKSETRDLKLLTKIPHQYQLEHRSAIGHNGNIYLVGGEGTWSGSDRVDCFDINKREWIPIKEMKNKRFLCSLAVIDDKMFVGGGGGWDNSVECFLMKEQKWIDMKPTTTKRCELSCWNGKLVATGGHWKSSCVELYDELSGDWLPLPSMNKGRYQHGTCTTKDDQLVVVGGAGVWKSVECLKM